MLCIVLLKWAFSSAFYALRSLVMLQLSLTRQSRKRHMFRKGVIFTALLLRISSNSHSSASVQNSKNIQLHIIQSDLQQQPENRCTMDVDFTAVLSLSDITLSDKIDADSVSAKNPELSQVRPVKPGACLCVFAYCHEFCLSNFCFSIHWTCFLFCFLFFNHKQIRLLLVIWSVVCLGYNFCGWRALEKSNVG